MEQNHFSEANSHLSGQKIVFFKTLVHHRVHNTLPWPISSAKYFQSTLSETIYLISSHLRLGLTSDHFPSEHTPQNIKIKVNY
jgi:hypothetical protein